MSSDIYSVVKKWIGSVSAEALSTYSSIHALQCRLRTNEIIIFLAIAWFILWIIYKHRSIRNNHSMLSAQSYLFRLTHVPTNYGPTVTHFGSQFTSNKYLSIFRILSPTHSVYPSWTAAHVIPPAISNVHWTVIDQISNTVFPSMASQPVSSHVGSTKVYYRRKLVRYAYGRKAKRWDSEAFAPVRSSIWPPMNRTKFSSISLSLQFCRSASWQFISRLSIILCLFLEAGIFGEVWPIERMSKGIFGWFSRNTVIGSKI